VHSHILSKRLFTVLHKIKTLKRLLRSKFTNDVAEAEREFHRIVHELTDDPNYYPNPGSWQQMQTLYFEVLGLKGQRHVYRQNEP
jgi:hypothetical protein